MRGIYIKPAGVDIFILCEDALPDSFFEQIVSQWNSLHPQASEFELSELLATNARSVVLVSDRSMPELLQHYPQVVSFVSVVEPAKAFERLTGEVTLRMLEALAGKVGLFHAAALGDTRTHDAMILVGPSGKGKTTASRFLGQHFSYLSDETAVVQRDFRIRPYPKPLSIIPADQGAKQQIDPMQIGISTVDPQDHSFVLKHMVMLDRQDSPCVPRLERLPMADGITDLVQQTSGLVFTADGLEILVKTIQECGGLLRLVYSEISETLPLFQALLSGDLDVPREEIEVQTERAPEVDQIAEPGQVQRVSGSSGYMLDDRLFVSVADRLVELSAFSADVWIELRQPLNTSELKRNLEDLYGPIPEDDFERVIHELKQNTILR